MRRVTEQEFISTVAERWKAQYSKDGEWLLGCGSPEIIYERLLSMPKTCTADDIRFAIGNNTWTTYLCAECQVRKSNGWMLGQEDDSITEAVIFLCDDCTKEFCQTAQKEGLDGLCNE